MVRERSRVAFTLVELLVVIGIIAILVGILLPVMNKVCASAQEAVCMSNMRQLGFGVQTYANQYYGALPQKGPDGSNAGQAFGPITNGNGVVGFNDPSIWFNAIPPLCNNKSYYEILVDDYHGEPAPFANGPASIFICPLAGVPTASIYDRVVGDYYVLYGVDSTGTVKNSTGMASAGQFKFALSYVWNSKLATTIKYGSQTSIKITDCQPSSEVVIITEKVSNAGEYKDPVVQRWSNANPSVYKSPGKIGVLGSTTNVAQSKADWTRFAARHRHGGHLLFADSHVQWFAWTDVQYPPEELPLSNSSDANQPGKILWSAIGPVGN